jgi:hypothetical protein
MRTTALTSEELLARAERGAERKLPWKAYDGVPGHYRVSGVFILDGYLGRNTYDVDATYGGMPSALWWRDFEYELIDEGFYTHDGCGCCIDPAWIDLEILGLHIEPLGSL